MSEAQRFIQLERRLAACTPAWAEAEHLRRYGEPTPPPVGEVATMTSVMQPPSLRAARAPARSQQVLDAIHEIARPGESVTAMAVSTRTGIPASTVRNCMYELRKQRQLEDYPAAQGGRRYWRKTRKPPSTPEVPASRGADTGSLAGCDPAAEV